MQFVLKLCQSLTVRKVKKMVRRKWKCYILLSLICLSFIIYAIYIIINSGMSIKIINSVDCQKKYDLNDDDKRPNWNLSRILLWTGMFGKYELSAFEINVNNTFKNCPVSCDVTFDKKMLSVSDAVIFHVRDIAKVGMPSCHAEKQMWIFYLQESSENTCLDLRLYKNVFNWTMTHRIDSDIYHPYSRILPINYSSDEKNLIEKNQLKIQSKLPSSSLDYYTELSIERKKELLHKSKLIVWVVSNCYTHSNRESFVREIEKYIPIDIYGKCGNYGKCPGKTSRECYSFLSKIYKFYFAFENSLCVDYITEKFFDSMHYDIVPIVYGNGNYSLIAPPGSYIDARQFKSPEELIKYLLYLDRHPEMYLKYFSWKHAYKIIPSDAWCSLCIKLNNLETKSYSDISEWWHTRPTTDGTNKRIPACLPYPDYPNEWWFNKFRKRHFILQ